MTKPQILQIGPYPDWNQGPLEESFVMHRYFEAEDKAAFLAAVGPTVRGIATRGELGANAAMIAAWPKLEVTRATDARAAYDAKGQETWADILVAAINRYLKEV